MISPSGIEAFLEPSEPSSSISQTIFRSFTATRMLILIGTIFIVGSGMLYYVYTKQEPKIEVIRNLTEEQTITKTILIDISGAVMRPGVYTLDGDSRTQTAVTAAGGFSENADATYVQQNLNLAALLHDGDKIYIPYQGEDISQVKGITRKRTNTININTASQEDLEALPKIGPVSAQRIVAYRQAHGRFNSVDDLLNVEGIGENTLESIRDLIDVQ